MGRIKGRKDEEKELQEREDMVKAFQVVSGDMFSRIHDPVVRIGRKEIAFNTSCAAKMGCENVEILFNPVERMMVVRPCNLLNALNGGASEMSDVEAEES